MTRTRPRRSPPAALVVAVAWIGAFVSTPAQQTSAPEPLPPTYAQMRHNSGQNVQPVFEGWNKNPDGTFNFVFGYYNRNFVEQPSVPLGSDNAFAPGDVDRGQPTFFYPRLNRNVFRVIVPADFGPGQLTWTLTVNGQTQRAVGSLGREWEIDPNSNFGGGESLKNRIPVLTVPDSLTATVGTPLELAATVVDDGNPPVAAPRSRIVNQGQDAFPTLHKGVKGPVNVPLLPAMPRARGGGVLSVGWTMFRAPSPAEFTPREYQVIRDKQGGSASTRVTFTQPGTYALKVEASDGSLRDIKVVTVTVMEAKPTR